MCVFPLSARPRKAGPAVVKESRVAPGMAGRDFVKFGEVSERSKEHAWKVCIRQKRIEGSNPSLSANSMVTCIGPLATITCEPRQARKGAAVASDSCAGVWLM